MREAVAIAPLPLTNPLTGEKYDAGRFREGQPMVDANGNICRVAAVEQAELRLAEGYPAVAAAGYWFVPADSNGTPSLKASSFAMQVQEPDWNQ